MITTNDDQLAEKLRRLRDHGAEISDLQRHLGARPYLLAEHTEAGYNQRMTDIQAALGSAQMHRCEGILSERRRLARRYDAAFKDLKWLRTPAIMTGCEHGYQSYPCLFQPKILKEKSLSSVNKARNDWMDKLQKVGISTRPATHAIHMLSYYRKKYTLKPQDYPNAHIADQCSISLPLFHGLSEEEQDYIIENVLGCEY
jgi:dTDP-4-amino-4,6-dideoxygalactose transaminase